MTRLADPYPPNLSWRPVGTRLFILTQVLVMVGALSMHTLETMGSSTAPARGLPYYLLWMQCVGMVSLGVNGPGTMLVLRRGWRRMPGAADRYARLGLFGSLPTSVRWELLAACVACLLLASWLAQQLCAWLLGMSWAQSLPQAPPPYHVALFNLGYGMVVVHVFEYFQDRAALSEARQRLAQQHTAEAQLHLLRSQLDPHMLFNTLSNLYELIDENPGQARALLAQLVDFLRSSLNGSRATSHPLADEFKLASDYLSLMQVRMGTRLQPVLSLPPALARLPVPAMLLQPLVENAIKHGLEKRRDGGLLSVSATQEAGQLVLQVCNTGSVPEGEAFEWSEGNSPQPQRDGGFGLHYVRHRLQALYGASASLSLRHLPGGDLTEVTLRMPLHSTGSVAA